MQRVPRAIQAIALATAGVLMAALPATAVIGQTTRGQQNDGPVTIDGTTQLGACDSLDAVSADPTPAFTCLGSPATDLTALRIAYRSGGMNAVARVATSQKAAAMANASGGHELTGYVNAKSNSTTWIFYATVIYGTIRTNGTITEYGRFFTRDEVRLRGNVADFKFSADRSRGSAMRFQLSNWFSIVTGGASWSSTPVSSTQSGYGGDPYQWNHSYNLKDGSTYYTGKGFYAKSKVKWWNQESGNPSASDGSWTLTESHGPMDCVANRSQRCQWR